MESSDGWDDVMPGMFRTFFARLFNSDEILPKQRRDASRGWFLSRAQEIHDAGVAAGVRSPTVLVLVHTPNDVIWNRLPIQGWCSVVGVTQTQVDEVIRQRTLPIDEGGLGADADVLRTRIDLDTQACRGFDQLTWPDVASGTFYHGVPLTHVYLLSDVNPVADWWPTVPRPITLEQNQLVPASGALLVPLKVWLSGLATFNRQREHYASDYGTVTLGQLIRSGVTTAATQSQCQKRGVESGFTYVPQAMGKALDRLSEAIRIVELPAQLFPRSRADLAREQAKLLDIIARATSIDDATASLLKSPTLAANDQMRAAGDAAKLEFPDDPASAAKAERVARAAAAETAAYEA
eukprot:348267-Amphidinium_carterae.1